MAFDTWPACAKSGGGGAPPGGGALQPVSAAGGFTVPIAAWALDMQSNAVVIPNRLGNTALDLTSSGVAIPVGPDSLIRNTNYYQQVVSQARPVQSPINAALRLTGPMSLVLRAFVPSPTGGSGQILLEGGSGGGVSTITYALSVSSAGNMGWFSESGVFPGQTPNPVSSTLPAVRGRWEVYSARRDAAGRIRFGVGESFQNQPSVPPITGGNPTLFFGSNGPGNFPMLGGLKDVAFFNGEISDAEVIARRRIMLGV